jgi:hypothetical protein
MPAFGLPHARPLMHCYGALTARGAPLWCQIKTSGKQTSLMAQYSVRCLGIGMVSAKKPAEPHPDFRLSPENPAPAQEAF